MTYDKSLGKWPTVAADTNLDLFRLDLTKIVQTGYVYDPKKREHKTDYLLADGDLSIPLLINAKYSRDESGADRQIHPSWSVQGKQIITNSLDGSYTQNKRVGVEIISHLPTDLSVTVAEWRRMLSTAYAMSYIGSGGTLTERVLTELMVGTTQGLWRP